MSSISLFGRDSDDSPGSWWG